MSNGDKPTYNGAMISADKFDRTSFPAPRPNFDAPVVDDYKYIGEQFSGPPQGGPQSTPQQPQQSGNQTTAQQGSTPTTDPRANEPPPVVNTFDPVVYKNKMDQARNTMDGALYNVEQNMGYERYQLQQANYDLYNAMQEMDAGKEWDARQKIGGIEYNVNKYIGQEYSARQDGQRAINNVEMQYGPDAFTSNNTRSQTGAKMKQQQQKEQPRHGSNVPRGGSGSGGRGGSGGGRSGGSHGR